MLVLLPAGEERLRREGPVLPEGVHGGGGEGEGGQQVREGQVQHEDISNKKHHNILHLIETHIHQFLAWSTKNENEISKC